MASERRIGTPQSRTRAQLLDAAEALLLGEGYAAVTSRRLGAQAGVSAQLVHYYFRTMDDLFLEVFRRRAEENLARFARATEADSSLTWIWKLASNPSGAAFAVEFAALANHRKAIRTEVAAYAERFRRMQHDAVAARLSELGISPEACPATVALLVMTGLAQIMSLELNLGFTTGHEETVAFVDRYLAELDPGGA